MGMEVGNIGRNGCMGMEVGNVGREWMYGNGGRECR